MDKAGAHQIVSFDTEELILVDETDREIGYSSKAECHAGDGVLHRAFSIFVFNADGELLLQQRSAQKQLWPLYWSNSCCSHPRRGETMEDAAARRLYQELHLSCELEFMYKFRYRAKFDTVGAEHEYCWVYTGTTDSIARPNENEIAASRFASPSQIDRELREAPESFTPWFKLEWQRVRQELAPQAET